MPDPTSRRDRPGFPDAPAADLRETVHATCVVVGEAGVLIRGESRAGKSSLALALIEWCPLQGGFAALVGDDRVRVEARHGRVVARPHPAIAGLIEVRGHGIVAVDHVPACILRLVVDLVAPGPRLPEPQEPEVAIVGVALPCLRIDRAARNVGLAPGLVLAKLLAATPGVSSQSHTPPRCGEAPAPHSAGAAGVA
ncbi:hypothetical protein FV222_24430 [Methylobacterium sp. WL103]|uniref:HPr kinase/phosphorylase n=1 Tax=Methylobacterium sp. WL103 TaxID=2603891 RepID=UPI0011C8925A|nr:hypothetical protein [Methylobacterium sp. WL103]TXM91406.1 hypothetical protein FV222_24430 [Methylobacterium sp. WL103]